jgi:hypothetical protein
MVRKAARRSPTARRQIGQPKASALRPARLAVLARRRNRVLREDETGIKSNQTLKRKYMMSPSRT